MIRFLMVRKERLMCGAEIETHYTIDGDVNELENALRAGGFCEDQYDHHALIGCEVIDDPENKGH